MSTLHFGSALLPSGWADDVQVVVTDGTITKVTEGVTPEADDERHRLAIGPCQRGHVAALIEAIRRPAVDGVSRRRDTRLEAGRAVVQLVASSSRRSDSHELGSIPDELPSR